MKKPKFIPEFDDIPTPRTRMPELELEERRGNFDEVELGYTRELAAAEAARCLSCRKCIGCGLCLAECDRQAIVYDMDAEVREFAVESVVIAGGSECFDATRKPGLGYAEGPNVVTAPELERMLSPTGPYAGAPLRPGDGAFPRRVAFVQCVGSREEAIGASFCSTSCCNDALRLADGLVQTGRTEHVTVFHRGMRPFGRVGQKLYGEALERDDIDFVFAEVTEVKAADSQGPITVTYDAGEGKASAEFDLVVLSVGRQASRAARSAARLCRVGTNKFGFLLTGATSATSDADGVSVAGACSGPTDIARAGISAGAAFAAWVGGGVNASAARDDSAAEDAPARTDGNVVAWLCAYGLGMDDRAAGEVAERVGKLTGVAAAAASSLACAPSSVAALRELCEERDGGRVAVLGCHPGSHERFWRERCAAARAGLSVELPPVAGDEGGEVLLEDAVAEWLARDRATGRTEAGARADGVLVVGASIAGLAAADELARHGVPVTLVTGAESLSVPSRDREFLDDATEEVDALVERVSSNGSIEVLTNAEVDGLSETDAGFEASAGGTSREHGVVILAGETVEYVPERHPSDERIVTQGQFARRLRQDLPELGSVVMIQCVGSRSAERPYCSRTCCTQAVKNALRLKRKHPDVSVTVLHRTIRVWGFDEEMFLDALDMGVEFIHVAGVPEVSVDGTLGVEFVGDDGEKRQLEAGTVVLSTGTISHPQTTEAARALGVQLDGSGFVVPADEAIAPLETGLPGVFVAGPAVEPMSLQEAAFGGRAAAGKAILFLRRGGS